jgi:hypothetical protein
VLQFARVSAGALYDDPTLEEALMRRSFGITLTAALVCLSGSATAQSGDLSGVTMRVLDDVSDIDAVILELDAGRGEGEGSRGDEAEPAESDTADAAEPEQRVDEPRERDNLHDPDDDERSEGKLEDNDIERPAAPPVP